MQIVNGDNGGRYNERNVKQLIREKNNSPNVRLQLELFIWLEITIAGITLSQRFFHGAKQVVEWKSDAMRQQELN